MYETAGAICKIVGLSRCVLLLEELVEVLLLLVVSRCISRAGTHFCAYTRAAPSWLAATQVLNILGPKFHIY